MRRYAYSVVAVLGLLLAGCGVNMPSSAAPVQPPHHLRAFIPAGVKLTGHKYFASLATEVLWAQPPGAFPTSLWLEFVQDRHHRWRTVYRHQWKDAAVFRVSQRRNPTTHESDVIVALGPGGNDFYTTLANFLVAPTHVALYRTVSGYSGYVTTGHQSFQERFSMFTEHFTWKGVALHRQYEGPLSTIPAHAKVIPVYLSASQSTPTIGGSTTVRLKPGQSLAIRPATAYAMKAFEKFRLGLFGPYHHLSSAQTPALDTVHTIGGLSYQFTRRGVYYLDVVSNAYSSTPQSVTITVLVGDVPAPPKPHPTVTFGTGFNDASFTLTGVSTTFSANADVHWLLDDPSSAFDTTTIDQQLYEVKGATNQLIDTTTVTVDPQDNEIENNLGNLPMSLTSGTYQMVFIIQNKVVASGDFTIR